MELNSLKQFLVVARLEHLSRPGLLSLTHGAK